MRRQCQKDPRKEHQYLWMNLTPAATRVDGFSAAQSESGSCTLSSALSALPCKPRVRDALRAYPDRSTTPSWNKFPGGVVQFPFGASHPQPKLFQSGCARTRSRKIWPLLTK